MRRGIFCGLYHSLDKSKFDLTVWKQERVFSYPSIAAALAIAAARWLQSLLVTASFTTDIPEPIVQSNNSPRQGRELAQMHIIPFINTRCYIIAPHFLYLFYAGIIVKSCIQEVPKRVSRIVGTLFSIKPQIGSNTFLKSTFFLAIFHEISILKIFPPNFFFAFL